MSQSDRYKYQMTCFNSRPAFVSGFSHQRDSTHIPHLCWGLALDTVFTYVDPEKIYFDMPHPIVVDTLFNIGIGDPFGYVTHASRETLMRDLVMKCPRDPQPHETIPIPTDDRVS